MMLLASPWIRGNSVYQLTPSLLVSTVLFSWVGEFSQPSTAPGWLRHWLSSDINTASWEEDHVGHWRKRMTIASFGPTGELLSDQVRLCRKERGMESVATDHKGAGSCARIHVKRCPAEKSWPNSRCTACGQDPALPTKETDKRRESTHQPPWAQETQQWKQPIQKQTCI